MKIIEAMKTIKLSDHKVGTISSAEDVAQFLRTIEALETARPALVATQTHEALGVQPW